MTTTTVALTTVAEHLDAFRQIVEWADELHMTYAWAASSNGKATHWKLLPLERVKRAVLGIHFAQTEPMVLRKLHSRKVLRVMPDTRGVFHPKLLLGIKGRQAQALLGSSNFTSGGFAGNTEVNILLRGLISAEPLAKLAAFIDEQSAHPRTFVPKSAWFSRYERLYASRPKPPKPGDPKGASLKVSKLADLTVDWSSYVDLIANQEGRPLGNSWVVRVFDDPEGSYLQEVEACQNAFGGALKFEDLTLDNRKLIAGWGGDSTGYFGRMSVARDFKNLTTNHPQRIGRFLDTIPLRGTVTLELVRRYLEGVTSTKGVGMGVATRLLSMKRPDRFLPVNNANKERIFTAFSQRAGTVDAYLGIIKQVWSFPWFKTLKPDDPTGQRIWRARVALLDAILYYPVSTREPGVTQP